MPSITSKISFLWFSSILTISYKVKKHLLKPWLQTFELVKLAWNINVCVNEHCDFQCFLKMFVKFWCTTSSHGRSQNRSFWGPSKNASFLIEALIQNRHFLVKLDPSRNWRFHFCYFFDSWVQNCWFRQGFFITFEI